MSKVKSTLHKPARLKFALGNAKLSKETATFSLPAGYTCIGAQDCLARANRITGKLKDGPLNKFRCYAASAEALFRNIRVSRWRNFELLKGKSHDEMVKLIERSIPRKAKLCRIHASGDFFSQVYFDAWLTVARRHPNVMFYGYTKALPFWIYRQSEMPKNFVLTASRGGKFDSLIDIHGLKSNTVVFSEKEAKDLKLKIDHDDTLCWKNKGNFASLLHNTQPAGTPAAKAWQEIKTNGRGGYSTDYLAHYDKAK